MDSKLVLQQLTEASGVSGYEDVVRALVIERMQPLVNSIFSTAWRRGSLRCIVSILAPRWR